MGPLLQEQALDMHLLLAIATFVGAASAMPMVYYPAQYIPADEVLVRVPRQLAQGPLRPVRQSDFAADQEASADTAYGAAPVGRVKIQTYRGPSRGITTSHPGDTTTPSLLTSRSTTRRTQTTTRSFIHSITPLLNLYLQTKRLELLSKWFCYKNTRMYL